MQLADVTELLQYVRANRRVCPIPLKWNQLWEMLPDRQRAGSGWEPPLPLILAAWADTPALMKMLRVEEHIRYAAKHGVLPEIDAFLRGLQEDEWAHLGEI
jgi:hypothetical protein